MGKVTSVQQQVVSHNKSSPKWWAKMNFSGLGKYKKIIAPVVALVVLGVVYMCLQIPTKSSSYTSSQIAYTSTMQYVDHMEARLRSILGSIKDAGEVEVMIAVDGSPELKLATTVEEKTTTTTSASGGSTQTVTVVTDPIIVEVSGEEEPLILMEIMPSITGVVVVASGASYTKVKLQMLEAVQALLNITGDKVKIIEGR